MIGSEEQARGFVAARCDGRALERLERFAALLAAESERQNLVARSTLPDIWRRHIADSAQLLDYAPDEIDNPWLDLGAGAGFPGLVVAALRPDLEVYLVESRRLRIGWLERAVAELGLSRCNVVGARVESMATMEAGVISARAFAPLPKLLALAERFSTTATVWLLPKGRSAAQELSELPPRLQGMFHVEQSFSDADSGIVVGRMTEGSGR